jgi:hypothetical protein
MLGRFHSTTTSPTRRCWWSAAAPSARGRPAGSTERPTSSWSGRRFRQPTTAAPHADAVECWIQRTAPALVVAATDDAAVNAAIDDAARERELLVSRADEAGGRDVGSVVVSATATDGPVTVAVSTDGTSPAVARELRRRLQPHLETVSLTRRGAVMAVSSGGGSSRTSRAPPTSPTRPRGCGRISSGGRSRPTGGARPSGGRPVAAGLEGFRYGRAQRRGNGGRHRRVGPG